MSLRSLLLVMLVLDATPSRFTSTVRLVDGAARACLRRWIAVANSSQKRAQRCEAVVMISKIKKMHA
jgi:hypothetical protein